MRGARGAAVHAECVCAAVRGARERAAQRERPAVASGEPGRSAPVNREAPGSRAGWRAGVQRSAGLSAVGALPRPGFRPTPTAPLPHRQRPSALPDIRLARRQVLAGDPRAPSPRREKGRCSRHLLRSHSAPEPPRVPGPRGHSAGAPGLSTAFPVWSEGPEERSSRPSFARGAAPSSGHRGRIPGSVPLASSGKSPQTGTGRTPGAVGVGTRGQKLPRDGRCHGRGLGLQARAWVRQGAAGSDTCKVGAGARGRD